MAFSHYAKTSFPYEKDNALNQNQSVVYEKTALNPQANETDANLPTKDFDLSIEEQIKLPIVMYHSTFKKFPSKFNITPEQLEQDILYLKKNGYTAITVSDLIAFQDGEKRLPERSIMLTFDDGYTNNYFYAYPILKKHGVRCVMSVIGYQTDRNYGGDEVSSPSYAHVDYEQIKEMHQSGLVEIQNHTYNLHYSKDRQGLKKKRTESASDYERLIKNDLSTLDKKLQLRCGIKTTAVAYPYGAYSIETEQILKDMGYRASFTCAEGINTISRTSSLFNLRRYNRPSGKSSDKFFKKLLKD